MNQEIEKITNGKACSSYGVSLDLTQIATDIRSRDATAPAAGLRAAVREPRAVSLAALKAVTT